METVTPGPTTLDVRPSRYYASRVPVVDHRSALAVQFPMTQVPDTATIVTVVVTAGAIVTAVSAPLTTSTMT